MKVLLVEDNIADILIIQEAFEELGNEFSLEFVKDGKLASEKLKRSFGKSNLNYDLVFLDINIPNLSGRQILKYFKEDSRYSDLTIVILTTSTDVKDIRYAYQYRANAFVSKPLDIDEFLNAIKNIALYFNNVGDVPLKPS